MFVLLRLFTGVAKDEGAKEEPRSASDGVFFSPLCPPFSPSFIAFSLSAFCFAYAMRVCFSMSTIVAVSASPVGGKLFDFWNAATASFVVDLKRRNEKIIKR